MTRDPRAEAHRARQRAMREAMRPGPPDALADAYDELHSALADAMRFDAAQGPLPPDTDATELSGADTDRPEALEAENTWVFGEHRITLQSHDIEGDKDARMQSHVRLNGWVHRTVADAINQLPDGTWDVRITAVRRGE